MQQKHRLLDFHLELQIRTPPARFCGGNHGRAEGKAAEIFLLQKTPLLGADFDDRGQVNTKISELLGQLEFL